MTSIYLRGIQQDSSSNASVLNAQLAAFTQDVPVEPVCVAEGPDLRKITDSVDVALVESA